MRSTQTKLGHVQDAGYRKLNNAASGWHGSTSLSTCGTPRVAGALVPASSMMCRSYSARKTRIRMTHAESP